MTRIRNLTETPELTLNLEDFKPPLNQRNMIVSSFSSFYIIITPIIYFAFITAESIVQMRPWLGIDHVNKAPKRTRYSYYEKAIKIYN